MALVVAACVSLSACNDKTDKVQAKAEVSQKVINEKSSFEDKASYAVGASVGGYMYNLIATQKEFVGALNEDLIKKGFSDAIANKPELDVKEIETILRELDKKVQNAVEEQKNLESKANLEAGKKFLEENSKKEGVKVTKSGLQYKVIKDGNGVSPKTGDTIKVIYKGSTIDGKVFDEQKEALDFPLDNMIPGWIEGLQLMKTGAQYEFYIPSELAYGERGAGDLIKGNSVLVFDVTLVDVKSPKDAKSKK